MGAENPQEMLVYETVVETDGGPEMHTFKQKTPSKPRKRFEFREYTQLDTVESWTSPVREAVESAGGVFAYGHLYAWDAQKTWESPTIPSFDISLSNLDGVSYSNGREQGMRRAAFENLARVLGASELSYWASHVYATGFRGRNLNTISNWSEHPEQIQGLPEIKDVRGEQEPGNQFVAKSMPPKYSKTVEVR